MKIFGLRVPKTVKIVFSVLYFLILGYLVFFAKRRRNLTIRSINLVPIRSTIAQYQSYGHSRSFKFYTDLFGNLLIFVPVAFIVFFLFPRAKTSQVILTGFLLSLSIEVLQYVFEVGYSEIDDLIINTLGTIMGVWMYNQLSKITI